MGNLSLKSVLRHFDSFCEQYNLLGVDTHAVVAVSGGIDSVFLAYLMHHKIKKQQILSLKLIYINHGTRKLENKKEQIFVEKLAVRFGASFETFKVALSLQQSNFEKKARDVRRKIYRDLCLEDNTYIYLGHHIDDSYEWSLMQQFKSSNPNSNLGIPLKTKNYRRPLMCFTKEQIINICQHLKIEYLSDLSNLDTSFERNYVRHTIVPKIKERFPSYLKHYVERSNRIVQKKNDAKKYYLSKNTILLMNSNLSNYFSASKDVIYKCLYELSDSVRGTLSRQVNNLIDAQSAHKQGPLVFSGGVEVFLIPGALIFVNKSGKAELLEQDRFFADSLIKHVDKYRGEFLNKISNSELILSDLLYYSPNESWPKIKQFKPIKKPHPLLPLTSDFFSQNGLSWQWVTRYHALQFKSEKYQR